MLQSLWKAHYNHFSCFFLLAYFNHFLLAGYMGNTSCKIKKGNEKTTMLYHEKPNYRRIIVFYAGTFTRANSSTIYIHLVFRRICSSWYL